MRRNSLHSPFRILLPALALATLSAGCGDEDDCGRGIAAICRMLSDGDSYRFEFLDAAVSAGYALQKDSNGLVRIRLLGADYPDVSGPDDLADCNDPGDGDYDGQKCEAWRTAWLTAHGTTTLDLSRINGCYQEGLELLAELLLDKEVTATEDEGEVYPWDTNVLAYVRVGCTDVSTWLVERGYAIAYDTSSGDPCEECPALEETQTSLMQNGQGCLWSNL